MAPAGKLCRGALAPDAHRTKDHALRNTEGGQTGCSLRPRGREAGTQLPGAESKGSLSLDPKDGIYRPAVSSWLTAPVCPGP